MPFQTRVLAQAWQPASSVPVHTLPTYDFVKRVASSLSTPNCCGSRTSNIKFICQGSALDISKLQDAYALYWKVIHDDISVKDASIALDDLMHKPQLVSFNVKFLFLLGCLLIVIQVFASCNELYSNVFDCIAAALADSHKFCYTTIAAASIVLILPGFIILCGSLKLASHNIISDALSIGATAYLKITQHRIASTDDLTCGLSHKADGPWYQQTPSLWWAFLTVPLYSLSLRLRNQAPYNWKETLLAITGILFQLPYGLANGGLFSFVSDETNANNSYISGLDAALQLVSVSIGLTIGLGSSGLVFY
ncbi:hypothetical protein WOLCODRAFT_168098 [Wolfiporia cocos MD-104 SS10]|uniref:Uncharacterized protein n=1 Tax=Wolfiporia cocos (strain MD-104) TaxID=742152 RepID=A0A2H3JZM6_WOLCO|nr:hypothetical protein WOLCODRAFT_168098 [Wolfiporia cocos MD-104 SS10]